MKKMEKQKNFLPIFLFCCLFMSILISAHTASAATLMPTAQNNLQVSLKRSSDLVPTSDGYMRVFHKTNSVGIEYYDNTLQIQSKKDIPMELPLWGGF